MKDKKIIIGIIGVGFVGGALKKYFQSKKCPLVVYDKYKELGSPETVNQADIVFIATPTPYRPKKGFDLSSVESAIKILQGSKVVVLKSSVVPGITDALQTKYPKHKFLFNPEFLREVSAYEDLIHPDRQILGVTNKSKKIAEQIIKLLPKAKYEKIMPAKEAEMVKYMANSFLALKVVFANEFFEIAKKLKVDYKGVSQAVGKDLRIGESHLSVEHGGYRGYGGTCFPKDVNALIEHATKSGVKTPLLKAMRAVNRKLLKSSGLNEEYFLLAKHRKV